MNTFAWQLQTPVDAIIFDCDGTLTSIEGIDELANLAGIDGKMVQALTAQAMGKTGLTPEIYQKRLDLIRPTKAQLDALGKAYLAHSTPQVKAVIALLQKLNKKIYIISAGLSLAVSYFGEKLTIPREHIFAVAIQFDGDNYLDFDHASPLIDNKGKRIIVEALKQNNYQGLKNHQGQNNHQDLSNLRGQNNHHSILYVGDGLNDLAVKDLVTRFVGYGGAYYRQNIAEQCDYYIDTLSLSPLLPLALTLDEAKTLSAEDKVLYQEGVKWVSDKYS
jgi:phosphoserine phosphatase